MSVDLERSRTGTSGGFLSYLKEKELSYFPTGALRWWLLILLVLAWTVEQFDSAKMGPVLVYLLEDFKITLTTWGYVGVASGVVYSGAAFLLSSLADKYGRRPMMILPLLIYIPIAIAIATAGSFMVMAVLSVMVGATMAGMDPAVKAASRDITPRMGRAVVFAWVSLAYTMGALLSNWVASWTIPIWPGWRPQFYIAAGFTTIIVLILVIFYRDLSMKVRGQIVKDQMDSLGAAIKAQGFSNIEEAQKRGSLVLKDWRMWALSMGMVFWTIPYVSVARFVPLYLTQYYGIEPTRAAVVTSWFWIIFTCSVFVSGYISDRAQIRKTVTAFGGLSTGIAFMIAAALPKDASFGTLALAWSVTGFFSGFIYPAWCAIISENAEEISPFGVARAFSINVLLGMMATIFLNLYLPRVVAAYGWSLWMGPISGLSCFAIGLCVAFGRGPWFKAKKAAA